MPNVTALPLRPSEREHGRPRVVDRIDTGALETLRRGGHAMNALCDAIAKTARSGANVLVRGECGTGKEIVARAIHEASARGGGPFITVRFTAVPEAMLERYLFGHADGALGLFRAASGGTLLLDEIGELPLSFQCKILHAVETKEVLPLGAERPLKVDARIVATTQCDLTAMGHQCTFRQDLLHRLRVLELHVPALRERRGDVAVLANELRDTHARRLQKHVTVFAPEAMSRLTAHDWPGNVRELSNVIERAVVLCDAETIREGDLPVELRSAAPPAAAAHGFVSMPMVDEDLEQATRVFQRAHIARVLDVTNGSRDRAAERLGLSPATLYRYLNKVGLKGYGLEDEVRG